VTGQGGGFYVYGFMRASEAPPELDGGVGDPPGVVRPVADGEVAALVTEVEPGAVAPRRNNLLAHAEVLRRAMDHGPVLPMRWGMVIAGEDGVRVQLSRRAQELVQKLDALQDRIEMSVSALYREDVLLREVVAENPAVAAIQRNIRGRPSAATHFDRIRLGELVAQAVQAKRERDGHEILHELESHALAVAPDAPLHERGVLNAAFLVPRDRVAEFDAAVERVSRERAARMQFKLLGPLPPHSFVGTR